jgi:hypothetical protein
LLTHITKVAWRRATPEITPPAEFLALSLFIAHYERSLHFKSFYVFQKNFLSRENLKKMRTNVVGCVLAFGMWSQCWQRFGTVRLSLKSDKSVVVCFFNYEPN